MINRWRVGHPIHQRPHRTVAAWAAARPSIARSARRRSTVRARPRAHVAPVCSLRHKCHVQPSGAGAQTSLCRTAVGPRRTAASLLTGHHSWPSTPHMSTAHALSRDAGPRGHPRCCPRAPLDRAPHRAGGALGCARPTAQASQPGSCASASAVHGGRCVQRFYDGVRLVSGCDASRAARPSGRE